MSEPRPRSQCRGMVLLSAVVCIAAAASAKLPGDLPGEEISEQQYFEHSVPRDSLALNAPPGSPSSLSWLDSAARTWDAPPIAVQMAGDEELLQMGMGAVFIPRMSREEAEPDIEIIDEKGDVAGRGKPGRKYNLVPGTYFVMIGSGAHKQRIVRKVEAVEGKVVPLIPDWAALTVNVIDENGVPFRGEYELARIDRFEPYGRGHGRDPDLGEDLTTWILRPGVYKIFGVGQSYNTLSNFITVRLLPAEHAHILLVQNESDMTIKGGGLAASELDRVIASNWRYGIDIGGSVDFNAVRDRLDTAKTATNVSLSMLSRLRLKYEKDRVEWDSRLYADEGVLYEREEMRLASQLDEIRLMSLYTWRILPWFGPYGRFEGQCGAVPEYARAPHTTGQHFFIILNRDSTISHIDTARNSYLLQPAFSPLILEAGMGANMRIINIRFVESRLLAGFGFAHESRFHETQLCDSIRPGNQALDSVYAGIVGEKKSYSILRPLGTTTMRPEYGPEAALYIILHFGRFGTAESDLKIFTPVERIGAEVFKPDLRWRATLSWSIIRSVTLDYQAQYNLRWPEETTLRDDTWLHRILVRFSYVSR